MNPTEVRKLIGLAEHGKTRDMAIYAKACRKLENIQAQITALNTDKLQLYLSHGGDPSSLARWQRWADIKVEKLESQQQSAVQEKEAARQVAVKSVAKVQALEALHKKALKKDLIIKRRRAEQNGQPPDA